MMNTIFNSGKWHSFLRLRRVNLMCSWPMFVYAEHLWDTVGRMVHQHCPRSCCSRFGTLRPHGYSPVSSEVHAEETSTLPVVNGYTCYWLFFSLKLNMPLLRCCSRSSNFLEFAGCRLNAFTSHHSCSSPWPPSAVLSFPTSSPSDDTGPPIPTLQVQKGVTEHSLAWTAPPGHPSPRPECTNHRQG